MSLIVPRKGWLLGVGALCVVAAIVISVLVFTRSGKDEGRAESLVIPEGWRASQVYPAADRALDLPRGTTRKAARRAARHGELNLPREADGNPEGYLFPATYPIDERTTARQLLGHMAGTAHIRLRRGAATTYDALTVASLVQAEADNPSDMGKVSRVIANRLERGMPLGLDATINYALGRSTLRTTHADTRLNSPYNTYRHRGLPPTPVNNPGEHAIRAAVKPPRGDWLYFVTVRPGDTRFTDNYKQHQRWVREFNENQRGEH
ncbi:endolytic transglycosylase MltG [Streptomyces sp. AJS327]|uniref:endolytic transglycosylase MltG n=1 Tax=Streptomyces sp. AJS327 TaxID=2545265 RepID=UPI0015DDFA9E|nr:endolytic transglycosylase MltG [Streptomyces sp. AJS327]MBA0053128.1 endolytic transglycosylase MltG [Streptomyces sp. AJS327]